MKHKGLFMKILVVYCLAFIAGTNIWAMYILRTTGYNAYAIVNSINAVHGGELLLLCVKRLVSSVTDKKYDYKNATSCINNVICESKDFLENHDDNRDEEDKNDQC